MTTVRRFIQGDSDFILCGIPPAEWIYAAQTPGHEASDSGTSRQLGIRFTPQRNGWTRWGRFFVPSTGLPTTALFQIWEVTGANSGTLLDEVDINSLGTPPNNAWAEFELNELLQLVAGTQYIVCSYTDGGDFKYSSAAEGDAVSYPVVGGANNRFIADTGVFRNGDLSSTYPLSVGGDSGTDTGAHFFADLWCEHVLSRINSSAFTYAALVRQELDGEFLPLVMAEVTNSATRRSMALHSDGSNRITGELGGFSVPTPVTLAVADNWAVAALGKEVGDTLPAALLRGHKGVVGGAWTHDDAADGFDDNPFFTDPLSGIRLANFDDASAFNSALYAVVGIWWRKLTDLELEPLRDSIHEWANATPDFIVLLNQQTTGAGLRDFADYGADQTALAGTVTVAQDPAPGFFDGNVEDLWWQTNANSSTGLTMFGLQDFIGKRLVLAVYDRGGGETISLSGTDAGLVSALGSPVAQRVTDPTNSANRRSVWMYSCVVPNVVSNPIIAPTVRNGSSVEQDVTVVAWLVDADSSYELSAVASADSGGSTVTSQVTGATPNATAGDHVVAVAAVIRGDGAVDWTDSKKQPWPLFNIDVTTGTGAGQLHAVGGSQYVAGGGVTSYEDTLNLDTARMVSALIAVFSTGGGAGTTVDLSPGVMTFTPVPLTPVPGPVTVALSPGVLTFSPVAMAPQPQSVTVDLSPGVLTFQPVTLTPLSAASLMLSPGVLDFQAVPLTFQPGMATVELSTGLLQFVPVSIGETGAEVDITVVVGPTRTGSVTVGQTRTNSVGVGLTRDDRGN